MSDASLHSLIGASRSTDCAATVPPPRSRWLLRFALPLVIVLFSVGLLAYAARDALLPVIEVEVVPVVTRAAADRAGSGIDSPHQRQPAIVAQAPGWIEPDPFAITVQSLISGVVEEVLVLEGERVSKGDVIVRLIAIDAELAVRRARAELAELEASVARVHAEIASAEARLDEIRDEVDRKRDLLEIGGISPGEFARLEHRLRSHQSEVHAARASLREAAASIDRQQVVIEEAELALSRTIIRAPVDGVVLSRSVVPGTRLAAMAGDGAGEAHYPGVARLYDPANLQVRADVSLTDAAKVGLGTKARITTEAMPDHTFQGEVTRIMHMADIQRNTVQVKVRIDNPSPLLMPDMLTRVRFLGADDDGTAGRDAAAGSSAGQSLGSLRVYTVDHAVFNRSGDEAQVWVAEPSSRGRWRVARLREITLGQRNGDFILVRSGLRPGDRLIINPPKSLAPDVRVRIRPTHEAASNETEGS